MTAPRRVVVIGGGVIGLTMAYQLTLDGAGVTLVDARGTGLGASDVNAGWVCPADASPVPAPGMVSQALRWMLRSDSPLYIRPSVEPAFLSFMLQMWRHCNEADYRAGLEALLRLSEGTMELLDRYQADGVQFEMHAEGLLEVYLSTPRLADRVGTLETAEAFGLEPMVLRGDAVREHEPTLAGAVSGGVYFPHERHLDPGSLVRGLHRRCAELGVEIVEDAGIDAVDVAGTAVAAVACGERRFEADAFVLAAGAWSGPVSRLFGPGLPIRPGKGYSLDLPAMALRSPIYLSEARVAVTPLARGLRLSGTMEFGGLDERVEGRRVEAISRAAGTYFQDWEPGAEPHVGAGMRPMSPDGLPIIGRLDGLTNAYVSTGHAMLGVTLAASSASALSALILRAETMPTLMPFRADRFGGRRRRRAA
jgi:D-amino-acid dehydrogenase